MEHRKKYRKRPRFLLWLAIGAAVLAAVILLLAPQRGKITVAELAELQVPDYVDVQLISVDGHSRRGTALAELNGVVIHYVGNPGTTAAQNRGWYENPESTVSSHFLVGLDGEIIQCLPLNEISSATNHRNIDTISIEVCHPDETGAFSDATYVALVRLTAWLMDECGLEADQLIRHYDVTGKECPRYFVCNEEAWLDFKSDVMVRVR